MVSLLERLRQAKAETAKRDADPLRGKVEATVRGMEAISTAALLDLIGLPTTTGNARRISMTMRSMGFVPIKSRRLMPGGYRDTVTRGWARPVRKLKTTPIINRKTGVAGLTQQGGGIMSYQHLLAPRGGGFAVVHVQSCAHLGYVYPCGAKYRVQNDGSDDAECDDVAVVNSIDEAIPALLTYYEKQPPKWDRESGTRYSKTTPFGLLMIEKNQAGKWSVYRYYTDWYHPLLRDGEPAIFATAEEARRAADARVRDDYPNSKTDDGLSWAA